MDGIRPITWLRALARPSPGAGVRALLVTLIACGALAGCVQRELCWKFVEDGPPRLAEARHIQVTNRISILQADRLEGRDEQYFLAQIEKALADRGYKQRLVNPPAGAEAGASSGGDSCARPPASAATSVAPVPTGSTDFAASGADLQFDFTMLISQSYSVHLTQVGVIRSSVRQGWEHCVRQITLDVRLPADNLNLGRVTADYPELQKDLAACIEDVLYGLELAQMREPAGSMHLTGACPPSKRAPARPAN